VTVLADTSIWVDFFRNREPVATAFDRLLGEGELVVCGPVIAELLAGVREADRSALWLALRSLSAVELDLQAWRRSGELAHALRGAGGSVPLLDVLVAVAAVQAEASLWTRDRDFERIRVFLPELQLYGA
jgi:tRNA(fMet)-specific endonuclease VapC